MADLTVEVAGLRFRNPVLPAAGPPGRDGRALEKCAEEPPYVEVEPGHHVACWKAS